MLIHQTPEVQKLWPPSHIRFLSNSTHCFTSSMELTFVTYNQTSAIASPPCYQMPYQASLLSLVLLASPWFSPIKPIDHSCSRFAAIFSPSQNKLKKLQAYKSSTNCTSSFFACKNSSPQEIFSCSDTTWWWRDFEQTQNPNSPINLFFRLVGYGPTNPIWNFSRSSQHERATLPTDPTTMKDISRQATASQLQQDQ